MYGSDVCAHIYEDWEIHDEDAPWGPVTYGCKMCRFCGHVLSTWSDPVAGASGRTWRWSSKEDFEPYVLPPVQWEQDE